jgi:BTB/POZ domain
MLLKPLLANHELLYVDFRANTKIDAFFRPSYKGSVNSIEELMAIIDNTCSNEGFIAQHLSDFTIFVQEVSCKKEYRVHKSVLASKSPIFENIFKNDSAIHRAGKMQFNEFSSTTVSAFLRFLYTGFVQQEVNAIELFKMAAKYKVDSLMVIGEFTGEITRSSAISNYTNSMIFQLKKW